MRAVSVTVLVRPNRRKTTFLSQIKTNTCGRTLSAQPNFETKSKLLNYRLSKFLSRYLLAWVSGGWGGGYSPSKMTGLLVGNFENTPKRYQKLVLWACPEFISTPKRYQSNNDKLYNWHCTF